MPIKAPGVLALIFAFLATTAAAGAASGGATVSPAQQSALGAVEAADSETVVDIPDAALRRAVEEALEKETDEPITRGEMESLRYLFVGDARQLTGIEYAVNLRQLELNGGATDLVPLLAPLSGLTSLTHLTLAEKEIQNLAPLSGFTSLTSLNLYDNLISDLTPLSGLTSLLSIILGSNPISDLTPLSGLTSLTNLDLSRNGLSDLTLLSPLMSLTSLRNLHLFYNSISDLTPLSGFTSLTILGLAKNEIRHLAPLSGLTSLTNLNLFRNDIIDASPLAENFALDANGGHLNLRANSLSAKSLETDIPRLLRRGVVVLFDDPVRDAAEFFPAIADRRLGDAVAEALYAWRDEPVKGDRTLTVDSLAELHILDASNHRIEDLGGLELATGLRRLDLHGNSVAEPVKDFETLTIAIYCAISPVVDVTGGLIQTASGRASGFGMPRTKRSGCWVQAA